MRRKTAPRTGRREVEKQAAHIADYWRSVRVGVTQAAPGRLIVRALRIDPLAGPSARTPARRAPTNPTSPLCCMSAVTFVAAMEADMLRGTYVDPRRGAIRVRDYSEDKFLASR